MKIESYIQALQLAQALATYREDYNSLKLIATEENMNEAIKREAHELTKDGFDVFVNRMIKMFSEGDKNE